MGQAFEAMMLLCFGASWPFNIIKSLRSRTARGKSVIYELLVFVGYLFGLTSKFISGHITYVVAVYVLDLIMVSTDLTLTFRNRRLDRLADEKEAV